MIRKILVGLLLALPLVAQADITHRFTGVADNMVADGVTDPTLGPVGADPDLTLGGTPDAGDLIVCGVAQKTGDYANISASGYTVIGGKNNTSGGAVAALCKVAAGGDAAPDITSTDEFSGRTLIGQCAVWAGAQASCTDIVAHVVTDENTSAQDDIDISALPVTTDNTLVVYIAAKANDFETADAVIGASDALTELGQPERTSSAQVGMVWAYRIQTTAATVTPGNVTLGANVANGMSLGISIKPAAAAPVFTVSPTVTAQDTDSYTLGYTVDSACTFKAVVCTKDTAAPDAAEVVAGTCDAAAAALATASEAVTGADTTETGTLTAPIGDIYATCNNAGGNAALVTLADEMLDAPTGYQYDLLASVSATSPCKDLNDIPISPTIAAADVTKWPTTTSPSGYAFTAGTDCETQYTDPAGTRQTATLDVYDTSAGDWMSGGPTTVYFNNSAPACTLANCEYDSGETLINGVAMASVDENTWFSDADTGDVVTVTTSDTGTGTGADKRPAETSFASGVRSGAPTCASANTTGSYTETATDEAGDTKTVAVTWTCYDQVAVPDCASVDVASCSTLASAVNLSISATFECSNLIVANGIISQGTSATTQVNPFTSFDVVASDGACSNIPPWTTIFLDDVTAVPAGSVYIGGAAYSQAGAHYVAAMPGSGVTTAISGLAYRNDGALVINVGGTIVTYTRGIAQTNLGETVAAVCSPDYSVAGVPMDPDGTVCMTDIN